MTDLPIQIIPAGRRRGPTHLPRTRHHTLPRSVGGSRLLGPTAARSFLSSLVFALRPPPLEETSVSIRWARQAARAQLWGWQPAGSGSLTGTRAGCAAAHGRTRPGAGPQLASLDPGAQPRSAGYSVSESRSQHLPGSRAPRRGQPSAVAPQSSEVSVGRIKCSKPWAPPQLYHVPLVTPGLGPAPPLCCPSVPPAA